MNTSIKLLTILGLSLFSISAQAYCENDGVVRGLKGLSSAEGWTCLDSHATSSRATYLFHEEVEGRDQLHIVQVATKKTVPVRVVSKSKLEGEILFPRECGGYFMGARVLPGTSKVALLYAKDVIRVVSLPSGRILSTVDRRDPGAFYTCEGYMPNAEAYRQTLTVRADKRRIEYSYENWDETRQECTETPLAPEELSSVTDEIAQLEKELAGLDPSQGSGYIDYVTERLAAVREWAATGIRRSCLSRPTLVPATLAY